MINNEKCCGSNLHYEGARLSNNADIAEMFETIDGKGIEPGFFVTFEGEKIRKANADDKFVLGIVTGAPAFIGNVANDEWHKKYLKDKWGGAIYEEVPNGKILDEAIDSEVVMRKVLNPLFDNAKTYTPRFNRNEWVAVGFLGKIPCRDDGTCIVNGYCTTDDEGRATSSICGLRVLRRIDSETIVVLVR